jgi:hypothetical protein
MAMVVAIGATVGAQQGQAQEPARQGGGRGPQGPPRNLKVLPKDWTSQQVQGFMRNFTAGLGVQCTFCHVQDRASDEKPEKEIARKMIQMTAAINDQFLKGLPETSHGTMPAATPTASPAPAAPPPPNAPNMSRVNCFTCHRGTTHPLTAPGGGGH